MKQTISTGTSVPVSAYQSIYYHFGGQAQSLNALLHQPGAVIPHYLENLVLAQQVHGNAVHTVQASDCAEKLVTIPGVDALVTSKWDVALCIKTADCVPVLLYDAQVGVVGAAHAGREGTRQNILAKTVAAMVDMGACPGRMHAILGPGICAEHYPVSDELFTQFVADTGIRQRHPWLDIKKVLHSQLQASGLMEEHIQDIAVCTWESQEHFSYRRTGTDGRQISWIMIQSPR
jgi:YfiH family protein